MKKNFTVLVALMFSVLMLTGCSALMKDDPTAQETTISLDKSALTVAVPYPLKNGDISEHLGDAAPYVKQYLMKTSENEELIVLIFGFAYDKAKLDREFGVDFEPDLEGGLHGAVGNMQNVQHTDAVRDVNINGRRGKEITGTVKVKFKGDSSLSLANFRMMTFAKGADLWMVGVVRKPDDSTLAISNKIFKSIRLK